jgi:RES domain-containing protein
MEIYRLSKETYASSLSGIGAALKGARWNSAGIEMIYTASNRSLAMAEVAVHFSAATMPSDYMMVTIFVPDDITLLKLNNSDLPYDWNIFPHPNSTQLIGDRFITESKYCVFQVPSAVTQGDYNYLINPYHADFKRIKIIEIIKFPFDNRIFK